MCIKNNEVSINLENIKAYKESISDIVLKLTGCKPYAHPGVKLIFRTYGKMRELSDSEGVHDRLAKQLINNSMRITEFINSKNITSICKLYDINSKENDVEITRSNVNGNVSIKFQNKIDMINPNVHMVFKTEIDSDLESLEHALALTNIIVTVYNGKICRDTKIKLRKGEML
ncbi:MAG: hypothetical protein ACRCXX_08690 [Cetobacterium sp.]|uniref:hypothetical protein n=1 Tax=Cetobacterium sp. TaxID=2071632 RepID=UPI003F347698